MYFTTDVNSSAYGEVVARNNAGGRIENLVYYTIGTGIGAGVIQRGEFIGGVGHPEMGHYYVARHPMDIEKEFNGVCPSIRDVWKAMQLVQVWKLVQVFVVKTSNSIILSGMFKPTISLSCGQCDSDFPPRRDCLWWRGHGSTTHAGPCP